jgi:hypothetical protein
MLWLTAEILAIQEAEIRRIKRLYLKKKKKKKPSQKIGPVEWPKV